MPTLWLVLETSSRTGGVGLALDGAVVSTRVLDGAKRHNRDLVPACTELLAEAGFAPKHLTGIMVGIGPGSYTGLRVGLMAAKGFALAVGCAVVAVPTFHTLAAQAPAEWESAEVISDALQGTVYRQRFGPPDANGLRAPASELEIVNFETWKATATGGVTGPGADQFRDRLAGFTVATPAECQPTPASAFRVGSTLPPLSRAEWSAAEPLYLRASSAEEKAKGAGM